MHDRVRGEATQHLVPHDDARSVGLVHAWGDHDALREVPVGVLQSGDLTIERPLPEPVAGALHR
ncbi:MAG: hypothetical protein ACK5IN_08265 [Microbacterium sp.]|uniref:hypothetical protein n=1 Tax=Microbacterium sp. TaxID=51671 RepID=UPI003A841D38